MSEVPLHRTAVERKKHMFQSRVQNLDLVVGFSAYSLNTGVPRS